MKESGLWVWYRYFLIAMRLATLWENLRMVNAKHPNTDASSYQEAAGALLSDEKLGQWLTGLSPEDQARFSETLPLLIWALDSITE